MKGNPSLKSFWFSKKGEGGGGHNFKGAKGVPWMGLVLPWRGKVSQALWQVSKWDQTLIFHFQKKGWDHLDLIDQNFDAILSRT